MGINDMRLYAIHFFYMLYYHKIQTFEDSSWDIMAYLSKSCSWFKGRVYLNTGLWLHVMIFFKYTIRRFVLEAAPQNWDYYQWHIWNLVYVNYIIIITLYTQLNALSTFSCCSFYKHILLTHETFIRMKIFVLVGGGGTR